MDTGVGAGVDFGDIAADGGNFHEWFARVGGEHLLQSHIHLLWVKGLKTDISLLTEMDGLSNHRLSRDLPRLMDFCIAGKIGGDSGTGDLFHLQVGQGSASRRRLAEIGGEEAPRGGEQTHRLADEGDMIALHVETLLHPLGGGKGGGIKEDQIPLAAAAPRFFRQPDEAVGLNQLVPHAGEAVEGEVAPRPFQIGARHVHRCRGRCAAGRRLHAGGAGVAEEIEKTLPRRQIEDQAANGAMIKEEAGVEIVGEIDKQADFSLAHFMEVAPFPLLLVLRLPLLPLTHLVNDVCR